MKIVYMGTPEFSVLPLQKLAESEHEVVSVFTQPDRQKGRGKKLAFSPVKEAAIALNLPVHQPEKLREAEWVEILKEEAPDLIVVAAYGQILSEEILNLPKFGCINIHASILPKYRGASPIEAAILNDEKVTGNTIMYMAKGLDTGDIISQSEVVIEDTDTTESLEAKLSVDGASLLMETIPAIFAGTSTRTVQDEEKSCYAGKLDKAMGLLDFKKSAHELSLLVRGLYPWPCAFTSLEGKSLKIVGVQELSEDEAVEISGGDTFAPGEILQVTKKNFVVRAGEGALRVTKLQPEGKKLMDTVAFLNGYRMQVREKLGE